MKNKCSTPSTLRCGRVVESLVCLRAVVVGVVQGVNFRYHTRRVARGLLLVGWVRNRPDGAVEVIAEGPRAQLDVLLAYLRKGPDTARVDRVDVTWSEATSAFTVFDIVA